MREIVNELGIETQRGFLLWVITPLWVCEWERERERGRGGRLCRSQHLPLRVTWGVCLCERGWLDTECAWDRDMFFTLSQYISLSEWERERERRLCRSRYLQQRDVEKLCVCELLSECKSWVKNAPSVSDHVLTSLYHSTFEVCWESTLPWWESNQIGAKEIERDGLVTLKKDRIDNTKKFLSKSIKNVRLYHT